MDSRLTKCETAGNIVTFSNPTPAERDALWLHFGALKAQKHAVVADEVQHGDDSLEIRVHHYKNCVKCAQGAL